MENQYDYIFPENEGISIIIKDGKYGAVLSGGYLLIPPKYDYLSSFKNGVAETLDGRIDLSQNPVVILDDKFVHLQGYDSARDYQDSYCVVCKDGKYGVIDSNQKEVVPCEYESISDFSNGIAYVSYNSGNSLSKYFSYISIVKDHVYIHEGKYDEIGHFVDGVAIVCNNGKKGVINVSGKTIIDKKYEDITIYNDRIVTYEANRYQKYTKDGEILERVFSKDGTTRCKYSKDGKSVETVESAVFIPESDIPFVYYDSKSETYGLKDKDDHIITKAYYSYIDNFINGKAKVDLFGCPSSFILADGRIVLTEVNHETILSDKYYYGFAINAESEVLFEKDSNCSILLSRGEEIARLPSKWENSALFEDNTFMFSNKEKDDYITYKITPNKNIVKHKGSFWKMESDTFYLVNKILKSVEHSLYDYAFGIDNTDNYCITYTVMKTDGTIIADNIRVLHKLIHDLYILSKSCNGKPFSVYSPTGELLIDNQLEYTPVRNGYNVTDEKGVVTFIEVEKDDSCPFDCVSGSDSEVQSEVEEKTTRVVSKMSRKSKTIPKWLNNPINESDGLFNREESAGYGRIYNIVDKDGNLLFAPLYTYYSFETGFSVVQDRKSKEYCILSKRGIVCYRSKKIIHRIKGQALFYFIDRTGDNEIYTIINAVGGTIRIAKIIGNGMSHSDLGYEALPNGYFLLGGRLFNESGDEVRVKKINIFYDTINYVYDAIKYGEILIVKRNDFGYDYILDFYGNILIKGTIKEQDEEFIVIRPLYFQGYDNSFYYGHGVIDKYGSWVVDPLYESISIESDCFEAMLLKDSYVVKISKNKSFIVSKEDESILIRSDKYKGILDYNDNCAIICGKETGKFGLIDLNQIEILPPIYEKIWYINNGFYLAVKNGKYGIINRDGIVKVQFLYASISSCKWGWILKKDFSNNGLNRVDKYLYGMANADFNIIIPCIYSYLGNRGEYLSLPSSRWRKTEFEYLIHYDYVSNRSRHISTDKFPACRNGKWGILNRDGVEILPFKYQYLNNVDHDYLVVYEESMHMGVINMETQQVIVPARFKKIKVSPEIITAEVKKKVYIYNHEGELLRWSDKRIESHTEWYPDGCVYDDGNDWGQDSEMGYMIEVGADFD